MVGFALFGHNHTHAAHFHHHLGFGIDIAMMDRLHRTHQVYRRCKTRIHFRTRIRVDFASHPCFLRGFHQFRAGNGCINERGAVFCPEFWSFQDFGDGPGNVARTACGRVIPRIADKERNACYLRVPCSMPFQIVGRRHEREFFTHIPRNFSRAFRHFRSLGLIVAGNHHHGMVARFIGPGIAYPHSASIDTRLNRSGRHLGVK